MPHLTPHTDRLIVLIAAWSCWLGIGITIGYIIGRGIQ